MFGELVYTKTSDHLRNHGFYVESNESVRTNLVTGNCDAAVVLHGLGGNFYSSRLLSHFAQTLHRFGVSTVMGNTRGHDMINISTWGIKATSVGAAFETVSDAIYDVNGWVDFLVNRGHSNIMLFGHSLGAIKSLYSQAHQPHERVKSIIGLSATRLSYQKLIHSPSGEEFRQIIGRCQSLIDQGKGREPIEVPFPFPTWMTPQGYLEKYGPDENYNWMNFVNAVTVPTLLLFGQRELEENAAFEGLQEEMADFRRPNIFYREVADANHFYVAQFGQVDQLLTDWLVD